MSISSRIKQERHRLGLTQVELAARVGMSQQSLQKIEHGNTRSPRKLLELASVLGCSAEWLRYGDEGSIHEPGAEYKSEPSSYLYTIVVKRLPLISYSQAKLWNTDDNDFDPKKHTEWEYTQQDVSDNAFWIKVADDSMSSLAGLSIPEGYSILVETEQSPENGDLILVKFGEKNHITLKRLIIDVDSTYLKPLNEGYRTIVVQSKDYTTIGVVRESKQTF